MNYFNIFVNIKIIDSANMEEFIINLIANIFNNFDLSFCVTVNIATYIIIKSLSDIKGIKITTWKKRSILILTSFIVAIVYYNYGSDVKNLFNSIILAPVSWSWIFKPICDKFNIGYNNKVN